MDKQVTLNGRVFLIMRRRSVCELFPNGDRVAVYGALRKQVLALVK